MRSRGDLAASWRTIRSASGGPNVTGNKPNVGEVHKQMKVVLFCGGLGLRMREASEVLPKPMVPIGNLPVLWHVMKYYAHFGHTDFILCLGYRSEMIKNYFLTYNEALSNDFVLSEGGRNVELLSHDIKDWNIAFVETGLHAKIGERLRAVRPHLEGEEYFLANYGDVLTDASLPAMVNDLKERDKVASFLCVHPSSSFHMIRFDQEQNVTAIEELTQSDIWINGGFFVLRHDLFDYLHEGEDLVEEPFRRLIEQEQLVAHRHEGFWAPMDTLKDKQQLESMLDRGNGPWRVWESAAVTTGTG
jgi:glucose-1-phosphate cytidylyltransferase